MLFINLKVTEILKKFVPNLLRLRPIQRGDGTKITLDKGKLTMNKDFKIIDRPVCEELDENSVKYKLIDSFENLIGIYDWKVYNLFGNNFFESAIISVEFWKKILKILNQLNNNFD